MQVLTIFGILFTIVFYNFINFNSFIQALTHAEHKELLHKILEKCTSEVGISPEQGKKLYHGDFSNNDAPSQCFVQCLLKNSGYLNDAGALNDDDLIKHLLEAKHVSNV
jgi:hypothetical protein